MVEQLEIKNELWNYIKVKKKFFKFIIKFYKLHNYLKWWLKFKVEKREVIPDEFKCNLLYLIGLALIIKGLILIN